jgi:hypothetical protein
MTRTQFDSIFGAACEKIKADADLARRVLADIAEIDLEEAAAILRQERREEYAAEQHEETREQRERDADRRSEWRGAL